MKPAFTRQALPSLAEFLVVVPDIEGVFPVRISLESLASMPDELDEATGGRIFVAWPQPPRVGTRVRLELRLGNASPVSERALVVWARPHRPGVVGGFRAQLEAASPATLSKIRALVDATRERVLLADLAAIRTPEPALARRAPQAIRERVSAAHPLDFDSRSSLQTPRPFTHPTSTPDMVTETKEPEKPEPSPPTDEFQLDTERQGGWGQAPSTGHIALDLGEGADVELELALPAEPDDALVVPFANVRSYLTHFDLFLRRRQVYVTSSPAPAIGESVRLLLEVPDGERPLAIDATMTREVGPPSVPRPGWIATFEDPDGTIGERLETASIIAGF